MTTQIDNIYLETNTSIIENISILTNMFAKFINFWNNNFALVEDDDSYDESFESFLKTL